MKTESFFTNDVVAELSAAIQKGIQNKKLPLGISPDFSKAKPSLGDFNLTSPLVASLLEPIEGSAIGAFRKNEQGDWVVESYTWGTTDPDNGEGCCFVPFEIQANKESAKVFALCLKDTETTLDKMMNKTQHFKGSDLLNLFQRIGWSYDDALQFMAWYSFAFRTQRTIAQGLVDVTAPGLRKFHGVAEVMSHPAVTPIRATDIIGGFAQAGCVLDVLNQGQPGHYAIFLHPLAHIALEEQIVVGKNGQLPAGWATTSQDFYGTPVKFTYKGIPVVKDFYVPKDSEVNNTFDVYIIDLSTTRASMVYSNLMIPEEAIYTGQTLEPNSDCNFVVADIYENAGVVHSANYARNILISGLPLSSTCAAGVFSRVQNALNGEVPFPIATVPA